MPTAPKRKPLAPNNSRQTLSQIFQSSYGQYVPNVKSIQNQSVVTYGNPGRQNSEGFGGGNRVTRGIR